MNRWFEDMLTELGCPLLGFAADTARAAAMIEEANFDATILDVDLGRERTMPIAAMLKSKGISFVSQPATAPPALMQNSMTDLS